MSPRRLAVLWTLAVAVALSVPGGAIPPAERLPLTLDKWVHAGLFFGVGALWLQALPGRVGAVLAGGTAFAVASELWQATPLVGRVSDPYDVAADLAGLALGVAFGAWLARRERRRAGND